MPSENASVRTTIIPCLIPAFNNPTYLRHTVSRLSRYGGLKLFILDNASSYGPALEFYAEVEAGLHGAARVLQLGCNAGPRAAWRSLDDMPQFFCITDPDLEFNPELPADFIGHLVDLTETFRIGKAGFALSLADRDLMLRGTFRHSEGWMTIWDAEAKHWRVPLPDDPAIGEPLYLATIDTTFALYNKRYFDADHPWDAIRVAGRYACRHLPWYVDNGLPAAEEAFYRAATEFSYYLGDRPAAQVRELFARQDALASRRPGPPQASPPQASQ